MKSFYDLLNAIINFKAAILIKSIIAFVIIAIYALIRMAISGEDLRMPMAESIILLIVACILSNIIAKAISRKF